MTAEEVREKRRAERRQFKLDRARAIAEASLEAEKAFETSGVVLSESSVVIPSSATWKPTQANVATISAVESGPTGSRATHPDADNEAENDDEILLEEEFVDFEHLQLTLQEAFFLIWTMDCLSLLDPSSVSHPSQSPYSRSNQNPLTCRTNRSPFLVSGTSFRKSITLPFFSARHLKSNYVVSTTPSLSITSPSTTIGLSAGSSKAASSSVWIICYINGGLCFLMLSVWPLLTIEERMISDARFLDSQS